MPGGFRPRTLGAALEETAARLPAKRAVVFPGSAYTYEHLRREAGLLARGLVGLGVGPGAKVAIWLPNCVEWVLTNLAAASIGAITVPVNMRYRTEEAGYILRQSDAEVVVLAGRVLETDYAAMLRDALPLPWLRHAFCLGDTDAPGTRPYADLRAAAGGTPERDLERRLAAVRPEDVCHIQYTSGTTSRPKGAMLTHHNLLRDSYEICQAMRIGQEDSIFSALPFYHVAGYVAALLAALQTGGSIVSADHFDAGQSLRLIERERCTILRGVETMVITMMSHPDFGRRDLSSLRGGAVGSNAVEVLRDVHDRMGLRELTSVFGLSESTSASTMTRVDDPLRVRIETQGRPLPGVEARIVGPDTNQPLPRGARGEIVVRGWNVMKGYYGKPEETAKAIDAEGWLHTGDLGVIDGDGNLRFIDRIKDVIRVGGENVSAAEVESFLYRHPKVELVQVVAAPDPRLTQVCAAFVKTKPGVDCTAEEIIEHCRGRIASFKVPRHVFFVDGFPLTGSGKIQKYVLRDAARRELEGAGP